MQVAFYDTKDYECEFFKSSDVLTFRFIEKRLTLDTVTKAQDCQAVCAFVNDDLSKDVLSELKKMGIQCVMLRSAGYDHLDKQAAKSLNMPVFHVPSYSPESIAQFTLMLVLNLLLKIPQTMQRLSQLDFRLAGLMGTTLSSHTVGVIGTGKIGRKFIELLTAFNCRIIAYDPVQNADVIACGAQYVDLDILYATSDVISLHCILNEKTHHLLDETAFAKMKAGVVIVNVARGAVIDTKALIKALHSKKVAAAGLDVVEGEQAVFHAKHQAPLQDPDIQQLIAMPNVMLTPHQAFFTRQALESIAHTVTETLTEFQKGRLINCVV